MNLQVEIDLIDTKIDTKDRGLSHEAVANPCFEEVERMINSLDKNRYAVFVKNFDEEVESFVIIKKDNYFLCNYYNDDEYYLVNEENIHIDDEWEVDTPHPNVRPAKYFNKLDAVLLATKTYMKTGKLDSTLTWEVF